MLSRLRRATLDSGVVLSTPSDVKSVVLKLLELTRELAMMQAHREG